MSANRTIAIACLAALMAGCATFSEDTGFGRVAATAQSRTGKGVAWARSDADRDKIAQRVAELSKGPIDVEAAVQIALLNNRGLQATYAELGLAEADVVQAGRLANPLVKFERLVRPAELTIDRTFLVNVLSLLTMPARTDFEKRRFEITQTRVTGEVLQVAADTRRAWLAAVSAQETVKYLEQVSLATEAGAELAQRMAGVGNASRLNQAREQAFHAEVVAQLARAKQTAVSQRERLTRLMGLWGESVNFTLPERLPDLPKQVREMKDIEQRAIAERLDVRAAIAEAEHIAATMGLTKATGYVNLLELGYRHNTETGKPRETGYEIELRLPLFDWGTARVSRAQFAYLQAVDRAADTAVRARSEVREAYTAWRTAYDLAKHYRDEIVPLRKRISEETLLRYNGMLIGVFELLADARQQVAAVNAYIDALRDYWTADATLELAMTGKSPGSMAIGSAASLTTSTAPAAAH